MLTRAQNTKRNIVILVILQILIAINGLVIPRIIITHYGSETNGLISSILQYLTYISLIESGVGTVFQSALYNPLLQNDCKSISTIYYKQLRFYKKISACIVAYVIVLTILLPRIIKTSDSAQDIILLTIILSTNVFFDYYISIPYQTLITADQKIRVISIVNGISIALSLAITLLLIYSRCSIVAVKLGAAFIALIKPIYLRHYIKKNYTIDPIYKKEEIHLPQIKYGVAQHISYLVHTNTDIILLSIIAGTKVVSIYSIYAGITYGIRSFVLVITSGIKASLGNLLKTDNRESISENVDLYEFVQTTIATVLFTVNSIMISPFIQLFTKDIDDINYNAPRFGYCLICGELFYCYRVVYSTISQAGNKFRETQIGAYCEALINVTVSLLLIIKFQSYENKLLGVAIGTLLGMTSRFFYDLFFLKDHLIFRPLYKGLLTLARNGLIVVISVFIFKFLFQQIIGSWIAWIINGFIATITTILIALVINMIFNKRILTCFFKKTVSHSVFYNGPFRS